MLDLMRNGGLMMWGILAFGLIAVGAAARFAIRPAREQLAFVRAMARAALYSTLAATAADFGATLTHAADEGFRRDPSWYFLVLQGLSESMSPGIMGFTLLSLTSLLIAVGAGRAPEQAS